MQCKGEEANEGNPEDQACSGMGKLPRSESNVLLALFSNNIPAYGSVPFICAHNNRRAGQGWGAGATALRWGGQFCRKAVFLERQVGLGHACAIAVPTSLDPKCLLNILSSVSDGGFLLSKCLVITVHAWWWWEMEICRKTVCGHNSTDKTGRNHGVVHSISTYFWSLNRL